jgi:hypothetical protein
MDEHFSAPTGNGNGLLIIFFVLFFILAIYVSIIIAAQYKYGVKGGIGAAVLAPLSIYLMYIARAPLNAPIINLNF